MALFVDTHHASLNKHGEELCGDQVKILRSDDMTRIILSDGLGSGVKANIMATLTSEILSTMLRNDIALDEVITTVAKTLPVCKDRKLAYSTFTIIEINERTYEFEVINFDNPPVFYIHDGVPHQLDEYVEIIAGKRLRISNGNLALGDFLGVISDGVWYAGNGFRHNPGWDWDHIARFASNVLARQIRLAETVVNEIIDHTAMLYEGEPGDDATMAGVYVRRRTSALVFTGPPENTDDDGACVKRLMNFDGRRIVCGGTTGKIVSRISGQELKVIMSSLEEDVPPTARLKGVHLVTEGILTMTRATELIDAAKGNIAALPDGNNGAVLLALELLASDDITFLVGQKINPFYKHPVFPTNISIRKHLVEQLAEKLIALDKRVKMEFI